MICAFTGHRNIEPSHKSKISELILRAVEYAYAEGCREFLSGGAVGFDTLAAREVIRFRISHPDVRLVMVLPCLNQDEKWTSSQKDAYEYILSSADETVYVSEDYTPSCMRERNSVLASRADILIAYLSRSASGAGQTVRMAEKLNKKVYNLYPALERNNK